ncbi:DUF58 domain-containing protein [Chelatococcus reniformis]|uniref:DUF58 domain-containing protein n=1 Tax=Chelatococcus reniformis TaxID=1494448 RepID=A0A916UPF1_9HYPH|nr:DUF58 domain-containing protein [Chelatococcus reniformis]GGC81396.1 hypothetical protein GCM10010994_44210 [Chelatococcus reniformis]
MTDRPADPPYGLVARLDELIAARPTGMASGFAPSGTVRTHHHGGYKSAFRGRGMEFDEVRAYQPGDDIRTIDWRVTARTGRTHTKLFQEERERPVLILLDVRASMRFGTRDTFKSVLAARAAAVLTWVSVDNGDRVGGVILAPSRIRSHRPERSQGRILGFIKAMADATADRFGTEPAAPEPTLADALVRMRRAARPGTLVFVISDFRDLDTATARELGRLSLQAQVSNLFVYDRLEAAMPGRGRYRLSDGADVAVLDGDSKAARDAYAQHLAGRRGAVELLSRQRGMLFVPLQTGQDPADILHPERLRHGWSAARRTAA